MTSEEGDLNPLHRIVLGAVVATHSFARLNDLALHGGTAIWTLPWSEQAAPRNAAGRPVHETRELAGVAGLYEALRGREGLEVIYANDTALEYRGFDAVYRDRTRDRFILCEAKGTTVPLSGPSRYLARTKGKGLQLSWQWCWRSLLDCAFVSTSAPLFLLLLEPFLQGRVERVLSVSLLVRESNGWSLGENRIWQEADLLRLPSLREPYDLSRQREMLDEIRACGDFEEVAAGLESLWPAGS